MIAISRTKSARRQTFGRLSGSARKRCNFASRPQFALAASADAMLQAKIDLGDGKPLETAPGATLKIPVKVVRGEKSKGPLKCRLTGTCRGMNAGDLTIPADSNEGTLLLNINGPLPAGKYTLPLQAYLTVNWRNKAEAADTATVALKSFEKTASELANVARKTDEAKKATQKSAADAEAATRQALEGVAAADRTLHESQDRAKAAADALVPLEKASTDAAAKVQMAEAAQAKADKAVADTKGSDKNPAALKAQSDATETTRKAREESHQAEVRRDAARAAVQSGATQRTNAEAAKAMAEKKSADAAALAKTATVARTSADAAATDAAAKSQAANAEKGIAEQRARQANDTAQPRNYTFVIYSNPLVLQVDAAPIALTMAAPAKLAKPGEKIELPLQLERRFGFTSAVDTVMVLPPNASGMHAGDLSIPAGQTKGTLVVQLDPQVKSGEYNVIVRARMNFNGQASQLELPVVIKVQPPEKKK